MPGTLPAQRGHRETRLVSGYVVQATKKFPHMPSFFFSCPLQKETFKQHCSHVTWKDRKLILKGVIRDPVSEVASQGSVSLLKVLIRDPVLEVACNGL
jgi:hypothetical protein